MLIGVCLFRMSAMRSNPVIRNLPFWLAVLSVCLAVSAC